MKQEEKIKDEEKIRKAISDILLIDSDEIREILDANNVLMQDIDSWLEKQEGCEHIKKDWLEHLKQSWYKEGFIDGKYSNKTPKESEDERIRKLLISGMKNISYRAETFASIPIKDVIDYLEKQGEKIDFANREYWRGYREGKQEILDKYADFEKQSEQKPTVEMKTLEESLGIDSGTYNKIVDECIYGEQKSTWSEEDELHIRELERLVKQEWATAECENDKGKIHKMSDLSFFLKTLKPQLKQEWSEEDEKMLQGIWDEIIANKHDAKEYEWKTYDKFLDWLNFLKERVQPQPSKEWSEEDERTYKSITYSFAHNYPLTVQQQEFVKSLRPQSQWKPSEEQMAALKDALNDAIWQYNYKGSSIKEEVTRKHVETIESLYNDLKKLK